MIGRLIIIIQLLGCLWLFSSNAEAALPSIPDSIVVGTEPDYPPYCSLDENNQPTGFAVELIREAARAAGMKVQFKLGPWMSINDQLAEGRIDALPIVARIPERNAKYDFTIPYLTLNGAVFVKKDDRSISSLNDLKNKKVYVMRGDNAEYYVRRENISSSIYTTTTFDEAFEKLANGEADAVITQRIIGLKIIERLKLKSIAPLDIELPTFRVQFCFAVKKGNQPLLKLLNEGLSIVIANGTFTNIHTKWFGPTIKEKLSKRDIFQIVLYVSVPLIILLSLFWIFALRREVKRRTRHLKAETREHKNTWQTLRQKQILLEEREAQNNLLLNSTAEGIYGIDIHGKCTFINKSALEYLRFENENDLIGRDMHALIHHTGTDDRPCERSKCKIYQAVNTGEGTHDSEEIFWRSDNSSFEVEYFSYPIRKEGVIIGAVVTFWDISDRKKAEQELRQLKNQLELQVEERTAQLNKQIEKLNKSQQAMLFMVEDLNELTSKMNDERQKLEQSNKELDAFTYSVSHDLRAPLRAINGYSGFLLEDYASDLDAEAQRFLTIIRDNANKMDRLITDMLNLSRISRAEMRFSKVDMQAVANDTFYDLATEKEKAAFQLIIHPLPLIECDYGQIKQVWQNLIGNALKYSANAENKQIEIKAEKQDDEYHFHVIDQGAGFDPKYGDKLFGVFQRLHSDEEFEGTGVGLAIVQRIIHRHGGRVWAKAQPNKGATFSFSLPSNSNIS
ncbi:transporter substrate-binding domain-containing protein [Roseimarinus sediminis]|uniref:transporter substrate-binding domain-containing protein n=1 Tax=Roseimarinus sediminis TaxID=1610899 RepID=UPI003D1FD923